MRTPPPQRIVTGQIGSTGTVARGTDFTVTRLAAGQYVVRPFPTPKALLGVTANSASGQNFVAVQAAGSPGAVTLQNLNYSGAGADANIDFTAIFLP
jgi:hypothetical protein